MKKLDKNPMLCLKCEYNHDMIISVLVKEFKRARKNTYFSMNYSIKLLFSLQACEFKATFTLPKSIYKMFL